MSWYCRCDAVQGRFMRWRTMAGNTARNASPIARTNAKPRILRRARDLAAEFRRELAIDGRDIDPDLLEHPPVHQRDRAAAADRTLPLLALEPARRHRRSIRARILILDRFERGADPVA